MGLEAFPAGWEFKDTLHASANSRVMLCSSPDRGEFVAKFPPLGSATAARRFEREIRTLARAAGPHVMPVLEHCPEYSWYAMPRATRTLADVDTPRPVDDAVAILRVIADALRGLHEASEVHRDLKPGNVLYLESFVDGHWVVSDFGIVRNASGETTTPLTATGHLLGTADWAAPEQFDHAHETTPSTDVYAAGLIVNWLLTGALPHNGRARIPDESPIVGALDRATAQNPKSRFANLDDFLVACEREIRAVGGDIQSLIDTAEFARIFTYIRSHPEARDRCVRLLGRLDDFQLHHWQDVDIHGLASSFALLATQVADELGGLSYRNDVDPFLTEGVQVLRSMIKHDRERTRELAEALFHAIASIHQFAPATAALDWLEALHESDQQLLGRALNASGAREFFAEMTADRFPNKRRSWLLSDLYAANTQ